jgi:hypothetical protein
VVDLEKVSPLLRGKVIEAKINSLFSEKFSNKVLLDYVSKNFLLLIGNRLSLDDVTFGDIRKLEILEKRFFILDT